MKASAVNPRPVPAVEELDLQPPEEALAGGVVGEWPFLDMDLAIPAASRLLPVRGPVVPAAVGVQREAAADGGHGARQHLETRRLGGRRDAAGERHDVAVVEIRGEAEVDLARVVGRPELRDVGDERLAGEARGEVVRSRGPRPRAAGWARPAAPSSPPRRGCSAAGAGRPPRAPPRMTRLARFSEARTPRARRAACASAVAPAGRPRLLQHQRLSAASGSAAALDRRW